MKLPHSPTYYTSLELYTQALKENGVTAELTLEMSTSGEWAKTGAGKKSVQIRGDVLVVRRGLLSSLSTNALKMAISLMDELRMHNALWYYKAESNYDRAAMKELREKGVVLKTEDPHIHYISPLYIRKGSAAGVLAQTTELLRGVSRVHKDLIKDLNFKQVKFNHFDQLNLNNGNDVHSSTKEQGER